MTEYSIIYNRLRKNHKKISKALKSKDISAYRLYEKDIPEYPYLVDIYNDYAFVYEKGKKLSSDDKEMLNKQKQHQEELFQAIEEILSIPSQNIILKRREIQKGKNQYKKLSKQNKTIIVSENQMKFIINLYDYLDSGLFLDHRPLREIVKSSSQDKNVLNLFSYTGSISVAAALGGGNVTTVDMSHTYLDWAGENFKINNLNISDHQFIQSDILQFLNDHNDKYDLIILDPPSFSNSKRMEKNFNIQDDHVFLIEKCMSLLNESGVLYFSNNFTKFKMNESLLEKFQIKDITFKTIPSEFQNKRIHQCFEIKKPLRG